MTARAEWRAMREADLAAVCTLADRIHVAYPEDAAVLAERFRLYGAGAFVLEGSGGAVLGYALTHPWHYGLPPALNARLGALPDPASTYYIHDVALLPEARGSGAASELVRHVLARAAVAGVANISLVAVNGSTGFWAKHGFTIVPLPALEAKLRSYDDAARFMVRQV